jgi:hemoglobin
MASLFERLGGESAIEAAVALFYDKILEDTHLAPFFAGLDMPTQIKKQIAFMTMAFGGPNSYTGRDLTTAHARLVAQGLDDLHFDLIARHLGDTLRELDVGAPVIGEVIALIETTRDDVLGRKK